MKIAQIRDDAEAWLNRLFRRLQSFEMDQLERTVLLQVLDDSWKDHLHKVDMLRESISFRSFSQRDPKIEFKREASRLYDEMLEAVDGRVGEMAFNAQLRPPTPQPLAQPASAGPAQGNAPQPGQAAPPPAAPRPAAHRLPAPPPRRLLVRPKPVVRVERGAERPKGPPTSKSAETRWSRS